MCIYLWVLRQMNKKLLLLSLLIAFRSHAQLLGGNSQLNEIEGNVIRKLAILFLKKILKSFPLYRISYS